MITFPVCQISPFYFESSSKFRCACDLGEGGAFPPALRINRKARLSQSGRGRYATNRLVSSLKRSDSWYLKTVLTISSHILISLFIGSLKVRSCFQKSSQSVEAAVNGSHVL